MNLPLLQYYSWGMKYSKVTISAGAIISYRVIIGLWRENRLSKLGIVVYTVTPQIDVAQIWTGFELFWLFEKAWFSSLT